MRKLGLIAGGGGLPRLLAERCVAVGRPVFVIRLRGFAAADLTDFPGEEVGLAELGRCFSALRGAGCTAVCMVGQVHRPDLRTLKPDLRGLRSLPSAIKAARQGDDALLRFLIDEFAREGLVVEGAQEVDEQLTLNGGALGAMSPNAEQLADIQHAITVAEALGRLDVGQAVVVVDGLVLAVEAQEGTDAMLRRCAELPLAVRGSPGQPRGVLVKWPKPIQDRRVDLPTIGPITVQLASAAGLAGIAGQARGLLLVDRAEVAVRADALGLFIFGLTSEPPA